MVTPIKNLLLFFISMLSSCSCGNFAILGQINKNMFHKYHLCHHVNFPRCANIGFFPHRDSKILSTLCRDQPFPTYCRFFPFHVLTTPVFHVPMLPPPDASPPPPDLSNPFPHTLFPSPPTPPLPPSFGGDGNEITILLGLCGMRARVPRNTLLQAAWCLIARTN